MHGLCMYHAAQCLVQQECDHDIILPTCYYMMKHDRNESLHYLLQLSHAV